MSEHEPSVLLEMQNLTRRFGGLVATDDVSLSVYQGEILGIIGPNGAGQEHYPQHALGHPRPELRQDHLQSTNNRRLAGI